MSATAISKAAHLEFDDQPRDPEDFLIKAQPLFGLELPLIRNFSYNAPLNRLALSQQQRFDSWVCPGSAGVSSSKMPEGAGESTHANPIKYLEKFAGRDSAAQCAGTNNGMWAGPVASVISSKFEVISGMFGLNSNRLDMSKFGRPKSLPGQVTRV